MKNKWIYLLIIYFISIILAGILCYQSGKNSVKCESSTVYLPGETIHDTITDEHTIQVIKEVEGNIDTISLLQYCISNGLYDYLYHFSNDEDHSTVVVDTLALIKDFIKERHYKIELFDIDTIGKCIIKPIVQYNAISSVPFEFTPVTKIVTKKKLEYQPFIGLGIGTTGYHAQVGLFTPIGLGIGAGYMYNRLDENRNDLVINVFYKF